MRKVSLWLNPERAASPWNCVVSGAPGVYLLGTSLLRRRRSTYIAGADQDTAELAAHLAAHLAGWSTPPDEGASREGGLTVSRH